MRVSGLVLATAIMFSVSTVSSIQAQEITDRDHPFISRMSGLKTYSVKVKDYDEYVFPLERQVWGKTKMKKTHVEGKVTRITYTAPENVSAFQIDHYYENELKNAGYTILFSARGKGVGDENAHDWYDIYYPEHPLLFGKYLNDPKNQQHYLSAKFSRPEGDVYVTLYAIPLSDDKTMAQLDVIETVSSAAAPGAVPSAGAYVPTDLSLVIGELRRNGHYPVYGIIFEDGKATIKPGSERSLKMIADLLVASPGLQLYIVGNTDNRKSFAEAMELSRSRADMVARSLVFTYKADAARVQSEGVGPLCPAVANLPDLAAKNDRIELVVK